MAKETWFDATTEPYTDDWDGLKVCDWCGDRTDPDEYEQSQVSEVTTEQYVSTFDFVMWKLDTGECICNNCHTSERDTENGN